MARPKGLPKTGGRKPGTMNRQTVAVKELILAALDKVGGEKYLILQASENPTAFMTLLGKIIPTQLTGPDDGPVQIEQVQNDADAFTRAIIGIAARGGTPEADGVTEH